MKQFEQLDEFSKKEMSKKEGDNKAIELEKLGVNELLKRYEALLSYLHEITEVINDLKKPKNRENPSGTGPGTETESRAVYENNILKIDVPLLLPHIKTFNHDVERKMKDLWLHSILNAYEDLDLDVFFQKAFILIVGYIDSNRRLDTDNWNIKYAIDALVKAGIIADDEYQKMSYMVTGKRADNGYSTSICITDKLFADQICKSLLSNPK